MKTVMITAGAQGIGRAAALRFAEAGYRVSLCDTDKEAGLETVRHIHKLGGQALFLRGDAGSAEEMRRWFKVTDEEYGTVDVLVNNAGIGRGGSMLELDLDDFDRVLGVNLRGTFVCAQEAARRMRDSGGGGVIINIASTRALMSEPDTEAYAASKGGILALTHAMAVSLGRHGIRVHAISPGWIETGDWQYSERAKTPHHSEEDRLQHPVGRVGVPDDIAHACLYLAGPHASFITGQNLVIDGGMTVKMIYAE
ncbi:oxidoreductase [Paenibacillus swuensis]|uniref:Oxidoreductase n=1 Tax=Paenibacillus swuensis TaxID=1178515 RepID=A0A172TM85_9BACL|nr:glucose 1-dehydrogenase [Paenibacillus swuensis]ANE48140.1 oxidoreductase [Paenibacillus swuensis]